MRLLPAAASAVLGLALLAPAALPARAADGDVAFGTPTASSSFGEGLEFRVPVTLGAPVDAVELELRFPGGIGPYVLEIEPPTGGGAQELRYQWDLDLDGHLVPNTTVRARWVVRLAGGREPGAVSPEVAATYEDTRFEWQTAGRGVVRVHWYEGGAAFGARALGIAETAVAETTALLGVTEREPIDFFVYADDRTFREALGPGTRENVIGQAHAEIRTLFALITPDSIGGPLVASVIPHELVHLVFDTAVENPYRFPPRWLNEGLAKYLSEGYGSSDRRRVERAVADGSLMPLAAIVGQFPADSDRALLAYAESDSAVDHLVRRYGRTALVSLVLAYREGLTDDEAFQAAIGEDVAAFQAGWLEELGAGEPVRYGPQPAPPGPLPPDWTGPPPTPGPGESPVAPTSAPASPPSASPGTPPPGTPSGGGVQDAVLVVAVVGGVALALAAVAVRRARRRGVGS